MQDLHKGKSSKFEEQIEMFMYSANNERPSSEDTFMLLTPKSDERRDRAPQPVLYQRLISDEEQEEMQRMIRQTDAQIQQMERKEREEEERQKKRAEILIQEEARKREEEMQLMRVQQEMVPEPEEKVVGKFQLAMEIESNNQSKKSTLVQHQFKKEEVPVINKAQQEIRHQKEELNPVLSVKMNQKKERKRVTLDSDQWLKRLLSPNSKSQSQRQDPPPQQVVPVEQQKKQRQVQQFQVEVKEEDVRLQQNRRITLSVHQFSKLLLEQAEAIKQPQLSQQEADRQFIRQHIINLPVRKEERRLRLIEIKRRIAITQQRLKGTKERMMKKKQIIARLQKENAQLLARRQQRLKNPPMDNPPMDFEEYQRQQRFFSYLKVQYNFQILKFEMAEFREGDAFQGKFILAQDIYIKMRRVRPQGRTEAKIGYSPLLDKRPNQWLISITARMDFLREFFIVKLERYDNYFDTIMDLAKYYTELQALDTMLLQACGIFEVQKMEIGKDRITLKMQLRLKFTFMVTIHMFNILEPEYCEFFFLQEQRWVKISSANGKNKFIEKLIELVKLFSQQ